MRPFKMVEKKNGVLFKNFIKVVCIEEDEVYYIDNNGILRKKNYVALQDFCFREFL